VFSAEIAEHLPSLDSRVAAEELCLEMPEVKDGLAVPALSAQLIAVPSSSRGVPVPEVIEMNFKAVRSEGSVRSSPLLPLPGINNGLTRALSGTVGVRRPSLLEPSRRVRSAVFLPCGAQVAAWDLSQAPHERISLELDAMSAFRVESLARQAEVLRKWEHGQAEVVALFPRVPVELLSRVRFSQEGNRLTYILHPAIRVKSTRVHDLIAIRDRKSGEVHLVPERTNYQSTELKS
jgi:hypothetical protein